MIQYLLLNRMQGDAIGHEVDRLELKKIWILEENVPKVLRAIGPLVGKGDMLLLKVTGTAKSALRPCIANSLALITRIWSKPLATLTIVDS